MQFTSYLKRTLQEVIIKAFDIYRLQAFTSTYEVELGTTFQNEAAGIGGGFVVQVNAFIDSLIKLEKIHLFVDKLKTDPFTKDLSYVTFWINEYEHFFEKKSNAVKFAFRPFKQVIVNNNSAFLARKNVREALYNLSIGEARNIIINGKSKSGITYMAHYFSEIALQVECFEFYHLDLKQLKQTYSRETQFNDIHLAQIILDTLLIKDFIIDPREFKHTVFINHLREFFKNKNTTSLFYLDQFDLTEANNVFALVDGMVTAFNMYNIKCSIILGGSYNVEGWSKPLRRNTPRIELDTGAFSKEDVMDFFKEVYRYLVRKGYEIEIAEADFVELNCDIIKDEFFKPGIKDSNVEPIGDTLSDWYFDFSRKVNSEVSGTD